MTEKQDLDVDRLPDDDEVFAIVVNMRGANKVTARCFDGEERMCRIPGKMQKKVWIREDDLVIVSPWDFQDEKGDIAHRYEKKEAEEIKDSDMVELSDE